MKDDMGIAELGILADRYARKTAEYLPRKIDDLRQILQNAETRGRFAYLGRNDSRRVNGHNDGRVGGVGGSRGHGKVLLASVGQAASRFFAAFRSVFTH